uniref:Uncharacterized protein n=1 Tax=Vespula pensylvanica TaxID=30213 RepID=A0A834PJS6_VESPE|nr:hypothetical protein H0235_001902 [Vespula pensylvanica]
MLLKSGSTGKSWGKCLPGCGGIGKRSHIEKFLQPSVARTNQPTHRVGYTSRGFQLARHHQQQQQQQQQSTSQRSSQSLSGHVRVSHNVESEEKSASNASGEAATEPPETIRNADERCRLTHVFVKPTLPLRK